MAKTRPEGLTRDILDAMCSNSDLETGMFLFAKLVTHNLFAQPTRVQLDRELEPDYFPTELKQA